MHTKIALLCLSLLAVHSTAFAQSIQRSSSFSSSRSSSSGDSNRMELSNTPLIEALCWLQKTNDVEVIVDTEFVSPADLSDSLSVTVKNTSTDALLAALLKGTKLAHRVVDDVCLVSSGEAIDTTAKKPTTDKTLRNVNQLAADQALSKSIPMHFEQTPLFMAVEMIKGFSGLDVEIDEPSLRAAKISRHVGITIHSNSQPLSVSLATALEPVGLTYQLEGDSIVIQAKK